jgi:DHA1 family tetracycline resistance protein-like MFS transporter
MIVQGGMIRPVVGWIGERRTLIAGLLFGTVGFAVYGLAGTGPIFWIGVPLMSLWGLAGPAAQAIMTRRVAATEQGRLQGALSSIMGITGLIGPGLFSLVFARAIEGEFGGTLAGAPFLLASVMLLAGGGVAWMATSPGSRSRDRTGR